MNLRFLLPLLILTTSIAAGCASTPAENSEATETAAETSEGTSEAPEAATQSADTPELPFVYNCESGTTIRAAYPTTENALVEYKGTIIEMDLGISASGARYLGDELSWWTKGAGPGSQGTLFTNIDGDTGDIAEQCVQASDES